MRAVYATVERVMRASDVKASAYVQDEILEALESASDSVDRLVNLGDATRPAFAPWTGTISFDWPTVNNGEAYRFWLNQFRLHSLTSLVSGGENVYASALLWPGSGAPYSAIEIDTSTSDALEIGAEGTGQRSLVAGGIWGVVGGDRTRTAWTLGTTATSSTSTLTLNAPTGVGSIVLIGSERVMVTARSWVTSAQTASALTASAADSSITVATGSAFLAREEILIDSERMLIRDISGNVLTVQRAVGGSTLAAHSSGATVYWARSCDIDRGALGTTAASHSSGDAISIYFPPPMVEQLTVAYAIDQRSQENVGYASSLAHIRGERQSTATDVGAVGIAALEARLLAAYGRIRHRAI
jgi:hypothetical protein